MIELTVIFHVFPQKIPACYWDQIAEIDQNLSKFLVCFSEKSTKVDIFDLSTILEDVRSECLEMDSQWN